MLYKELLLKDIDPRLSNVEGSLRIYVPERNELVSLKPGLLICPGGGYSFCSPREAEPIAFRFMSEGFVCFVLVYSLNKKYPAPHIDLAIAVDYIRKHEKEFDLIPNSLSIIGFSAGGHLVASYAYQYESLARELSLDPEILRPMAIVLGYPVTLTSSATHGGTRDTICGTDKKLLELMNVPTHVTKDYPPTFVWTTRDDDCVPYLNTVELEEALKKNHVLYKSVIYDSGMHGGSLVNRSCYLKENISEKMKEIRDWASLAADFLFDIVDKKH